VLESAPIRGFCCGLLTGVVLGVGAAFAGGPLGDGRLSVVGPSPWQVAAVAALEVGIAAAVTAGAANWWYMRRQPAGEPVVPPPPGAVPSATRAERPGAGGPWPSSSADDDHGHVIYLDRWGSDPEGAPPGKRSGGPSALP